MLIPPPRKIKEQYPISETSNNAVLEYRKLISQAIDSKELNSFLFLIGPCSIHDIESSVEYASNLSSLQKQINPRLKLIMRCHVEKPRSNMGWKGFLYNPYLEEQDNIVEGICKTRQLFQMITDLQVPIASEFLSPILSPYFQDFVSIGLIGSRSAPSPLHRYFASNQDFTIGFKNPCSGNLKTLADALLTSSHPHSTTNLNNSGGIEHSLSNGNSSTIAILRGHFSSPNYDLESIQCLQDLLSSYQLPMRYIIDCAHQNSRYNAEKQIDIMHETLNRQDPNLKGLMIESHINDGKQETLYNKSLDYGKSITDPCLSWEKTKELILNASDMLEKQLPSETIKA